MKKFLLRTLVTFSVIFIFYFCLTMTIEYINKDAIKQEVNIEVSINENGEINIPDTPAKVETNYKFSIMYFFTGMVITIIIPILFYKYGGITIIKDLKLRYKVAEGALFFILYTLFSEIIIFPRIFFSSFYRGRLMGLRSYGFLEFLKAYFFSDLISILLSLIGISIIYYIFVKKKKWYLIIGALTLVFMVGSNYIYPYLDELENELYKMESSELKTKVIDLSKKAGIEDLDIRVVNKSNETSSMNAYMTGIGNTKRIVFWDTLLDGMEDKEILAVTAHEMGHYKLNHIIKSMIISVAEIIVLCLLIHLIMKKIKGEAYNKIDYIAHILFIINIFSIICTPLDNWYSRKIEIEADTFAIELTEDPYTSGIIEVEFINSNLIPTDVNKLYKWFAYDHPTVKERIELSNKYIKKNKEE